MDVFAKEAVWREKKPAPVTTVAVSRTRWTSSAVSCLLTDPEEADMMTLGLWVFLVPAQISARPLHWGSLIRIPRSKGR